MLTIIDLIEFHKAHAFYATLRAETLTLIGDKEKYDQAISESVDHLVEKERLCGQLKHLESCLDLTRLS